ncbi:MAG TPA: alkaline phosphatase PhoX [Candidatus Limnocylindria bacterium]|nr:alkaline phosphatase PhoX [Candidatus Limnocylindria bacterium]
MPYTRRRFLETSAAASAGLLASGALETLFARLAAGQQSEARGYGALVPDRKGLLDLPEGFTYRLLSSAMLGTVSDPRFSQRLTSGEPVPARHDGMAAFPGRAGVTVLVRNHELEPGHTPAVDPGSRRRYDPLGTGGTTTLWVNGNRELVRSFASLSGTFRNCAGGVTPWGSWLTAEECTYLPGPADTQVHDLRPDVARRHGYVFEVDARAERLVEPAPIVALGRFYHEALAVDPNTGFVYQTEDRKDGLIYRFRPELVTRRRKRPRDLRAGDLAQGGVLEALRIVDLPSVRTQNWEDGDPIFLQGRRYPVDWVAITDSDPDMDMERDPQDEEDDRLKRRARTAASSTRAQGLRLGAAQFARNEGMAYQRGAIYFCATNGGKARAGQVWRLDVRRQTLTLAYEPNDVAVLDGPDNILPAPNGDLIVCEDGRDEQFVLGITSAGSFYRLARNAYNQSEFAGACFSPDGRTMFVNIQDPGMTFAIWGPWSRRKA